MNFFTTSSLRTRTLPGHPLLLLGLTVLAWFGFMNQPLLARADNPPTGQSPLRQAIIDQLKTKPTLTLELFVMSQCPFGVQAEEAVIPLVKEFGPRLDFRLQYIVSPVSSPGGSGFRSLHGPDEVAENIRQLVIAERFPTRWLDYLLARATNYQSNDWQTAARQVGIDVGEVDGWSRSASAIGRLAAHSEQTLTRQIRRSPSLFIDGQRYEGSIQPVAATGAKATSCVSNTDCNDNNACTRDACISGNCENRVIDCDDGNNCTIDRCDPATGCTHTQIICDDSNACTTDVCDPIRGCVYNPINCDDNNPDTFDSCDRTRGCVNTPITRIYVNGAVASSGDGSTWDQAFKTLTEGLTTANSAAPPIEIWVAAGVYKPTSNTADRGASFSMKNGVTIYGGFATTGNPAFAERNPFGYTTTLSGDIDNDGTLANNSYHVISNSGLNSSAVLNGFVITGGNADGAANPNERGGGIFNASSSPGSGPSLVNCRIVGNRASLRGGGVYNFRNSPSLVNCSIECNQAAGGGGNFNEDDSRPTLTNCTLQSNQAQFGGAMYNYTSSPTLTNCTLQSNQATQSGGAMYNYTSSPTLTNCTLQSNQATQSGGAMVSQSLSSPTLTNSVVWNNGNNSFANFNSSSTTARYSLFDNTTNVVITGPGNLTTATSPFVSATSVELTACAPAIDAGNPASQTVASGPYSETALPATDLAGNARIVGGRVDMGAVELQSITLPTRLYVRASASGANTGLSWADAFLDLQTALTYPCSQSLTEIWVAAGVYKPTSNTADRGASFSMKNGVAIYGGFVGSETALTGRPPINPVAGSGGASQPSSTTLSGDLLGNDTPNFGNRGDNSYHVFYHPLGTDLNSSAVLDGFVITGGNANSYSFGPYSSSGGAMFNHYSSPTLTNCILQSNQAIVGGAMYNLTYNSPTLTNCAFLNNLAIQGGAMCNSNNCNPTLTNCTLYSNTATISGGAMYNSNSSPTLTNCALQTNRTTEGGAMYNLHNSSPSLTNCALQNNIATTSGGAMFNFDSSPTLTNCSLQTNQATEGGVMYNAGNSNSSPSLTSSVVWNNGGNKSFYNLNNSTITARYSLFDNTNGVNISGPGNLTTTTSPFVSTTSVALNACSPAINAGNPASVTVANGPYSETALPQTDLAGNARILGAGSPTARVDMGAVEFTGIQNFPLAFTAGPAASSLVCAGSGVSVPVSVSGTGPYSYQWYKDGAVLTGNSSATLSLGNVQSSGQGSYSLLVTGTCGAYVYAVLTLTVQPAPVVQMGFLNGGAVLQVTGGVLYERMCVISRINGYEIRQLDSSGTGFFTVSRPGPFTMTVTGSNGCRTVVQSVAP